MTEFIEYVAGSDETEARYRYEAGLGQQTPEAAERDAIKRSEVDRCNPPCHYTVWRVRTTLEQM